MNIVIHFLILFFILLLLHQIIHLFFKKKIVEGMGDVVAAINPTVESTSSPSASPTNEMLPNLTINQVYRQYDKKIADNTFLLAQQNAGNIEVLRQQIDLIKGMNQQVQDLSGNVTALQVQVDGLVQANQQYVSQIGSLPQITGATPSPIDGASASSSYFPSGTETETTDTSYEPDISNFLM